MSLDLSNTATKLLSKLASTNYAKIRKTTGAVLDPIEGVFTLGTTTTSDLIAAVTVVTELNASDSRLEVGDRIVVCDKSIEPKMEDIIVIPDDDGAPIDYRIISIGGSNFAGIRQSYRVVCRG